MTVMCALRLLIIEQKLADDAVVESTSDRCTSIAVRYHDM
jgi:hypothetical protein